MTAATQVTADKLREVTAGHDGTWVAHPELVKLATAIFNERMPQPNQLYVRREDVHVTAADLLNIRGLKGGVSEAGVGGWLAPAASGTAAGLELLTACRSRCGLVGVHVAMGNSMWGISTLLVGHGTPCHAPGNAATGTVSTRLMISLK